MPFQSEKQRKYLWANEPEIAREWTDKYGSRVKKQDGGYTGTWIPGYTKPINLDPYIYPKDHAQKFDTRKEWATSPQMYHNEIMNDYVTNVSKNLSEIPYVGNVLAAGAELGAPIASGILSLPYELKQSFDDFEKTLAANPEKYNSLGSTALGILQAIDDQNPLSTVYHRTKGALRPIGRRLKNTWDAIKSEFGGSAEAADLSDMIPKNLEKTIEEKMQSYNKSNEISPALRKAIEEGTSYNEWDRIPNEKYFGLDIQRNYIPTGSINDLYKTASLNQDEETFIDPNRIPGRIQKSVPRKMGMLERFRNRFYKPAAGAVNYGGRTYSPAQLNSMNALGGYYSEPAREKRRLDARRTNILNRAAKGKPVGNVSKLLGPNYRGTPGGGIQFTGRHEGSATAGAGYSRSDSGWSSSPFRRGGLASLWQR